MRFSIYCSVVIFSPTIIHAIMREATSETYGPWVYFTSYKFPIYNSSLLFILQIFIFQSIQQKYQKYLSYYLYQISLLWLAVKGLTTPLSRWLWVSCLIVQVLGDLRVVSYWIDTLVLKNWGKYLRYFAASPFPLQGKTNGCSRGSKKDFWRRCRGDLRQVKSSQDIPSTHHNSYPSHYIICHLPLVFLSPTSPLPFYSPSFSVRLFLLISRVAVCRHG